MPELPDGVVTFVFTDVEGSTALWEEAPAAMMAALVRHDEVIDAAVTTHDGTSVKPRGEGDSRFLVFRSALSAVAAAADIQRGLAGVEWSTPRDLKVRMSLHTGTAELMLGDYYGSAVNRAARLRGIAHGGQIVMSRSTYELVQDELPDGVSVRDMGEHRLKDLTRPEHVFQVDPIGLERDFPPLASLDAARTNLPVQLTEFVGRDREVGELREAIERSRLVTILAPGGAGKTRLAIQVAAELSDRFRHGVFFVDLAPLGDAGDVPQAIADAIGVTLGGDEELEDQLLGHLSGKEMLLVVDNVEHVIDTSGLVSRMLVSSPDLRVIATSRVKLDVTGESVFRIGGLEHQWYGLDEALESSAVELFIDAARRADTGFALVEDDLEPLSRILDLVGGLPLGILLAASWADALTVREIAEEIGRSMDFLETDVGDVTTRHRSMRAVFDYSWALLDAAERDRLAALSVFRGGFTRDAAGEVAGASLRELIRLEAKSLITLDRDAGRYAVHELIREYAGEHLHGDLRAAVRSAHTEFFAATSEEVVADFFSGRDQAVTIATFEAEYQNTKAALRRTLAARDAVSARRLAIGLQFLMDLRGWLRAAHELMDDVAEVFSADSGDDMERVVATLARIQMARLGMNLGIADDAPAAVADGVALLRSLGDEEALTVSLEALAEVNTYAGDPAAVRAAAREVISITSAQGSELWPAAMRNYLAVAYLLEERPDEALASLLEGDRVLARHEEAYMRTWNLEMQAMIQLMMGNAQDAIAIRLKQVELAASVGYARSLALGRGGLGEAYREVGRLDEADDCLRDALEIFDRLGMVVEQSIGLIETALTRAARGQSGRAVEILSAVSAHRTADSPHPMSGERLGDLADKSLGELRDAMPSAEFDAASAAGEAKGFDIIVKELLEGYEEAD